MKRCEWSFVVVSEEGGNKSRCYQVSTRTIVMAYIIICLSIGGLVRAAVVLNSKAIISFASRFERKKGENLREIAEALDSQADLVLGRNKKSGFLASMPQIRFIAPEFVHASFPILPLPRKKTFNKVVPVEDQFLVNKAEYLRPHLPPVRGRINSHFGI